MVCLFGCGVCVCRHSRHIDASFHSLDIRYINWIFRRFLYKYFNFKLQFEICYRLPFSRSSSGEMKELLVPQTNNSHSPAQKHAPKTNLFKRLNGKVRSFKFTRHAFRRQFIIPAICIRPGSRLGDRRARYTMLLVRLSRLDANTHTHAPIASRERPVAGHFVETNRCE